MRNMRTEVAAYRARLMSAVNVASASSCGMKDEISSAGEQPSASFSLRREGQDAQIGVAWSSIEVQSATRPILVSLSSRLA